MYRHFRFLSSPGMAAAYTYPEEIESEGFRGRFEKSMQMQGDEEDEEREEREVEKGRKSYSQ